MHSHPPPQKKTNHNEISLLNSNALVTHPTPSLTTCPSSSSNQAAHFRLCRLLHSRLSFSSWSRFSTSDDVSTSPCFAWTHLRDRFELVITAWVAAEGGGDSTCRIALATALAGKLARHPRRWKEQQSLSSAASPSRHRLDTGRFLWTQPLRAQISAGPFGNNMPLCTENSPLCSNYPTLPISSPVDHKGSNSEIVDRKVYASSILNIFSCKIGSCEQRICHTAKFLRHVFNHIFFVKYILQICTQGAVSWRDDDFQYYCLVIGNHFSIMIKNRGTCGFSLILL